MLTSRATLFSFIGILAIFTALLCIFVPSLRLLEVMRGLMLCGAAGVAAGHYPLAVRVVSSIERPLDDAEVSSLGWFLVSFSMAVWSSWYLVWKNIGSPDLWWDDYLLIANSFVTVTGFMVILLVVRATDGIVPAGIWFKFGLRTAATIAVILTGLAVAKTLLG